MLKRFCEPCFTLDPSVEKKYRTLPPPFGFNGFGDVIYQRTYARLKKDGTLETWSETIERVVNGVMSIRKNHMQVNRLQWNEEKMQKYAAQMYDYMWNMYVLPPGRGLWACGTDFMYERGSLALNNCAAVVIRQDISRSIPWLMDCLMCGAGVGFRIMCDSDQHVAELVQPPSESSVFVIEDSREGWVDSIRVLLESYYPPDATREPLQTHINPGFDGSKRPVFDYSKIRKAGVPIKGFGGNASGPEPLIKLHLRMEAYLDAYLEFVDNRNGGRMKLLYSLANIDAFYVFARHDFSIHADAHAQFDRDVDYVVELEEIRNEFAIEWIEENIREFNVRELKELTDEIKEFDIDGTRYFRERAADILMKIPQATWNNCVGSSNSNRWISILEKISMGPEDYIGDEAGNTTEYIDIYNSLVTAGDSPYNYVRLIADIVNSIGVCVVAGNVRRSAEIALCDADNETFRFLKDYEMYPERRPIGWMSNNSTIFTKTEDFVNYIPPISEQIRDRGEPGFVNLINIREYGRVRPNKKENISDSREYEKDNAEATNPCGEIPLKSYELCNLVEIFPPRCVDKNGKFDSYIFFKATEIATFYSSTVALLPTHYQYTNAVIAENRRIGVGLSGIVVTYNTLGIEVLTSLLRTAYRVVRQVNESLADEACVKRSIRVTTVKPSGTVSLLAGVPPGMHFPPFRYALRRVRIAKNSRMVKPLIAANVPYEQDLFSPDTYVFEFPIDHGDTKGADTVSPWEQFCLLEMLQREWSDNMVSSTITFPDSMSDRDVSNMLAMFAPKIKSCSMLPDRPNTYLQMPYSKLDRDEYNRRVELLSPIVWNDSNKNNEDVPMPRGCDSGVCMTPDSFDIK